MSQIVFKSVSKSYHQRPAVCDFSLTIARGERIAVLGHSGCGKTTVLRLLAGFIAPDKGTIEIDGQVVAAGGKTLQETERRNLGMVFQDLALWPHLTVKGNLEFGLKSQGMPAQQRTQEITKMLKRVHMETYIGSKPAQLSGGQQQRVALARALILQPKALLMDEPLSSLDMDLSLRLRKEILKLQEEIGFALLYVTHNLQEAFEIGTRIVVMSQGKIERTGPVNLIRKHMVKLSHRNSG
ncbi:MAG: ABC transporter ATP-binding protein [Planctomycetes bacterium]|nr:ABC transporter ATP-binding protein [Planctomycetota bacterium]